MARHFGNKMRLFVQGRTHVFETLRTKIAPQDEVMWIHAASLGEYEQAVPVMEGIRKSFPGIKILLTFFSPSGYEVKKKTSMADVLTYLPLDTPNNARKFIHLARPQWALFIKYEFWPNYLKELNDRQVHTLLISGVFRPDQLFFRRYGRWLIKSLTSFDFFFVQDQESKNLLKTLGFQNAEVSGDTRFDRVSAQLDQNNYLEFAAAFKRNHKCLVAGSTWPEDEAVLVEYINKAPEALRILIAPHIIDPGKINRLQQQIEIPSVLYSGLEGKNPEEYRVIIVDTIGLLSRLYSYADIAYVGGAMGKTGLHNILEPATFGVPVIIGPHFEKFPEAKQLASEGGLFVVKNSEDLGYRMRDFLQDEDFRKRSGDNSAHFIRKNKGAKEVILEYLHNHSSTSDAP